MCLRFLRRDGGVVVCFFAKTCRHFDGILAKKYTCSGFYLESEKKGVPELEFEEA